MLTRKREDSVVPDGFENFSLQEVGDDLSYEGMQNVNKELVLISAPVDFNINKLKGEQFVLNGSNILNVSQSENEDSVVRWELHSSLASADKHLNVLLPSQFQKKHLLANSMQGMLNVVRNIYIPLCESPSKKDKGTRLPKPIGLKARWVPYGSGYPVENGVLGEKKIHETEFKSTEYDEEMCLGMVEESRQEEMDCIPVTVENNIQQPSIKLETNESSVIDFPDKKKKKKKKSNSQESRQEEMGCTPVTVENNIQQPSIKLDTNESSVIDFPEKRKKKKRKSNSQESRQEEMNCIPVTVENNIQQPSIKLESNESLVIDFPQKRKKKKKKSNPQESRQEDIDENSIANENSIKKLNIKLENDVSTLKTNNKKQKKNKSNSQESSQEYLCQNPVASESVMEQPNTKLGEYNSSMNACNKKRKKKKKLDSQETHPENMNQNAAVNINDNSMQQLNIKLENNEDSFTNINEKHKKKKKKSNSQETDQDHIGQNSTITVQNTMISIENNTQQIKTEKESNDVSKKHKKEKRKSKVKDNVDKCSELNINEIRNNGKSPLGATNTLPLKKSGKKRKNKSILPNESTHKKQKLDTSIDASMKNKQKYANEESFKVSSVDSESDLDSDAEARIFGVIPKKMGFTSRMLAT